MNRRDFLKTSAFAAASAAGLAQAQVQGLVAEKKLGFAIVGLGRFGAGQLLRSLPECKYAKPVALVSGHPDKARDLAQKYGIKEKSIYNYENFDSIKDNSEVDVVYVVLPNSMNLGNGMRKHSAHSRESLAIADHTISHSVPGRQVLASSRVATIRLKLLQVAPFQWDRIKYLDLMLIRA